MKSRNPYLAAMACLALGATASASVSCALAAPQTRIKPVVERAIQPLMVKYGIAGMSVGLMVAGQSYVFSYGVASTQTRQPVTRATLFELGSISKTLTATLASYAAVNGFLSLSDKTSKYLPALQGRPFGEVRLLNLGTHTPGGLPLQVPDTIRDNDQLLAYFKAWQPSYAPGTTRTYANPGIGALGLVTAKSMGQDFSVLMETRLFPALGMQSSYIKVPAARMADYAQGYTQDNAPIRMSEGVLSAEAYGVKATATDMLRFIGANMGQFKLEPKLQQAINATHTGYFKAGGMTQDLIWEQYPYPLTLQTLRDGNSSAMALNPTPVTAIWPPQAPRADVWINKTGSTNGFAAYVAFIPEKRLGIVMLANKNFPIDARVSAAYTILAALGGRQP